MVELNPGERLEWPGLALDVLGPRYVPARSAGQQDGTTINNSSVVLRAETAAGRVMLTGDVELAAQADLLADVGDLKAEVLKVPHHGSRYSLPSFLAAVAPRVALVSVGAGNTYGHPSKSTMDSLRALGALVTRTDTDGDTAVVGDPAGPAVSRRGEPRGPPRPVRLARAGPEPWFSPRRRGSLQPSEPGRGVAPPGSPPNRRQ